MPIFVFMFQKTIFGLKVNLDSEESVKALLDQKLLCLVWIVCNMKPLLDQLENVTKIAINYECKRFLNF